MPGKDFERISGMTSTEIEARTLSLQRRWDIHRERETDREDRDDHIVIAFFDIATKWPCSPHECIPRPRLTCGQRSRASQSKWNHRSRHRNQQESAGISRNQEESAGPRIHQTGVKFHARTTQKRPLKGQNDRTRNSTSTMDRCALLTDGRCLIVKKDAILAVLDQV